MTVQVALVPSVLCLAVSFGRVAPAQRPPHPDPAITKPPVTQWQHGDTLFVQGAAGLSREIYRHDSLFIAWFENGKLVRDQAWAFKGDSVIRVGGRATPEVAQVILARRRFWIQKAQADSLLKTVHPPAA